MYSSFHGLRAKPFDLSLKSMLLLHRAPLNRSPPCILKGVWKIQKKKWYCCIILVHRPSFLLMADD